MKKYHKNPRKIEEQKFEDLRRWLDEFGDLSGIVHDLNSDEIISGNQRSAVFNINDCEIVSLKQLDKPDKQGTVAHGYVVWNGAQYNYRQVRWTSEQCERANIIANKAGGDWDLDILLRDFELPVLAESGFNQGELDGLLADLGQGAPPAETADSEPQISRADELRQEWGTELGQLWILPSRTEGQEHRLTCGDCTDRAVVERVMEGGEADGCFTSPPYAEQRKSTYGGINEDDYGDWFTAVQKNVRQYLAPDGNFFLNIKTHSTGEGYLSPYVLKLILRLISLGWLLKDEYCWERPGMPGDAEKMGKFKNQWEPIYWLSLSVSPKFRPRNAMHESSDAILDSNYRPGLERTQGTKKNATMGVREIGQGLVYPGNRIKAASNEQVNHPAAFPVSLPDFFIKAYSDPADVWLEPFSGSGTTLIACENLSRQCRAIEISPAYVAVALQRYYDAFQIRPYLAP